MHDFIIIGAGLGGLTSAALLANAGYKVTILESHTVSGGCASYFRRISKANPVGDFYFDSGATTLSGFREDQPLYELCSALSLHEKVLPLLHKQETGVCVHTQDNKRVIRYADKAKWILECQNNFGRSEDEKLSLKLFWDEIYSLEQKAWALLPSLKYFPPVKLSDYFKLPLNPKNLQLLPPLFSSTLTALKKFGLYTNADFVKFIDQQLIISTQNYAEDTPYLFSALALAYPSEAYYIEGGVYTFAKFIEDRFKESGGEIKFKHKVSEIKQEHDGIYTIQTNKGTFRSHSVISNTTIWNMAEICKDPETKHYFRTLSHTSEIKSETLKDKITKGWGAYTLYLAVEDKFNDYGSLYHQVHFKSRVTASESFFVSVSKQNDLLKAPHGWRTITISTHLEHPEEWKSLTDESYNRRKLILEKEIMIRMAEVFQDLDSCEKKYILSGSPATFEFYTRRKDGIVGGNPMTLSRNVFSHNTSLTPFEGLYVVGDTVFPGQGSPAVVLGGINLVNRILKGSI